MKSLFNFKSILVLIFIIQLSSSLHAQIEIIIAESVCNSYTTSNGQVFTSSGLYTVFLPDTISTDTILYLDLTVLDIIETTSENAGTITADQKIANYQWLDCINGLAPIADATDISFTPEEVGTYAVQITLGECVSYSECVDVLVTSTKETTFSNLTIFPNPSNSDIIFLGSDHVRCSARCFDVIGQIVLEKENIFGISEVDVSELNAGTYFFVVSDGYVTEVLKWMKM